MLLTSVHEPSSLGDVATALFGGRAMLLGSDPYALVGPGRPFAWDWPLYYPATALLVVSPLAFFPFGVGQTLFVGMSAALLAYALAGRGVYMLAVLLSAPMLWSVLAAQWTPLLTAAYLIPGCAWLWVAKPNFALPFLLATPSRAVLVPLGIGGTIVVLITLVMLPDWPATWLRLVASAPEFRMPVSTPLVGPLLLLAAFRWRQPEARLLLGMAFVPQTARIYNTLPLLLTARGPRQTALLTVWSWIAWLAPVSMYSMGILREAPVQLQHTAMVIFLYLPALIMVLRRSDPAGPDRRPTGPHLRTSAQVDTRYTGAGGGRTMTTWREPTHDRAPRGRTIVDRSSPAEGP